jgi:Mat/Ecp fimbriae major subunit
MSIAVLKLAWLRRVAGAAALLLAAAGPASAACTKAITVAETRQMNYGTLFVTSGGGTAKIAANGVVTAPAGFIASGATAAGTFKVTGSNNCTVLISFAAGTLIGPGAAMPIRNFTTDAGATPTLLHGGTLTFDVGADLVVNAGQAGGNYSGTYTVTVIY